MTRQEIIQEIKANNYFIIQELVCKHTFQRFGERSWQFLDTKLLHTLLVIRMESNMPMYINNWDAGGDLSQLGLRLTICQLYNDKVRFNEF